MKLRHHQDWKFMKPQDVNLTDRQIVVIDSCGGFLKWWVYPTTMGFPTKNDHFGVFWGYHHLRKHPCRFLVVSLVVVWAEAWNVKNGIVTLLQYRSLSRRRKKELQGCWWSKCCFGIITAGPCLEAIPTATTHLPKLMFFNGYVSLRGKFPNNPSGLIQWNHSNVWLKWMIKTYISKPKVWQSKVQTPRDG